jgi:hypothetical protein
LSSFLNADITHAIFHVVLPDIPPITDALLSNINITEQDVKDILQTLKIGKLKLVVMTAYNPSNVKGYF